MEKHRGCETLKQNERLPGALRQGKAHHTAAAQRAKALRLGENLLAHHSFLLSKIILPSFCKTDKGKMEMCTTVFTNSGLEQKWEGYGHGRESIKQAASPGEIF